MEDDLRTLSNTNILFKYADDINLLVPEISDVDINDKFSSVLKWAEDNRMIVNLRFLRNHLLLNGSKSDAIIIGTAQRHARAPQPTHLRVTESCVAVSDSLKLLGVTLDIPRASISTFTRL